MSFITRVKAIARTVSHFLGEGIWNIDLAGLSPKRSKLYKHLKIILITHRHFQSLRCGREAVALSFFTTMATVPLLAVILLIANKFGFEQSINVLVFVVLGGIGNTMGSLVSATALTILPETLRTFGQYRMLAYAVVLILVMLATNNPLARAFFRRISAPVKALFRPKKPEDPKPEGGDAQ